jgi:hypothetical protein
VTKVMTAPRLLINKVGQSELCAVSPMSMKIAKSDVRGLKLPIFNKAYLVNFKIR